MTSTSDPGFHSSTFAIDCEFRLAGTSPDKDQKIHDLHQTCLLLLKERTSLQRQIRSLEDKSHPSAQ